MSANSDSCVLLFVKWPAPGKVKTRLAKQLGEMRAAEIYRNFVLDILDTLRNLDVSLMICFEPADALPELQNWLGRDYSYVVQSNGNLGKKMKNAFVQGFARAFSRLVLIGSDLPDLPADFFNLALSSLDTHDAVLGPSYDGGYYLIGFIKHAFLPEAFDNVAWGTDRVFAHTVRILKRHQTKLFVLPVGTTLTPSKT